MAQRDQGWICLWRKFLETSFFKHPNVVHIAICLLLLARWKPREEFKGGKLHTLQPGEIITTLPQLAIVSHRSIQSVRTALKHLESCKFLSNKSTVKHRKITILNFASYQHSENYKMPPNRLINRLSDNHPTDNEMLKTYSKHNKTEISRKDNQQTNPQSVNRQLTDCPKSHKEVVKDLTTNKDINYSCSSARNGAGPDERFREFWSLYPRKTAKQLAYKQYNRLIREGIKHTDILTALKEQVNYYGSKWTEDDCKFCPHAATWLHQRRFEDQLSSPAKQGLKQRPDGSWYKPVPTWEDLDAKK